MTLRCRTHVLGGLSIAVRERVGESPPLFLLHGVGDSGATFDEPLAAQPLAARAAVAVDLPGFGDSAAPEPSLPLEGIAELLEPLVPEQTVVIGHSLGGVVATLLAERCRRVTAVVNVEGNLTEGDCGLISRSGAETPRDRYPAWLRSLRRTLAGQAPPSYFAALERADYAAFKAACTDLVRLSEDGMIGERFCRLRQPKLYVAGAHQPPASAALLRSRHVEVSRFATAGHWLMQEVPDAFATVVDAWLTRTRLTV